MYRRIAAWFLLAFVTMAGCGKPAPAKHPPRTTVPQTPAPAHTTAPAQTPPPAEEPPTGTSPGDAVPAASLFPTTDRELTFRVWDLGSPEESRPTQLLLADGERVAVVYNGRPYFAWQVDRTGAWREDPKQKGVLLRYLPPGLQDGATWSQASGPDRVWFHLARHSGFCPGGRECWALRVLNRGEEVAYVFAPGAGPVWVRATNTRNPDASFMMDTLDAQAAELSPEQRRTLLAGLNAAGPIRAPVAASTFAEYERARARELGLQAIQADLDGDGLPETIRGLLNAWSFTDLEVTGADGTPVLVKTPFSAHRFELVPHRPTGKTLLMEWNRYGANAVVGLLAAERRDGTWGWRSPYGWGLKHASTTRASRAAWKEEGLLTVEWDMGDPARHTRVREYRIHLTDKDFVVNIETEQVRPQGEELIYPSTPEGVLQAAYVAAISGLHAEVPRYFTTAEAASAFAGSFAKVPQELAGIELARPTGQPDQWCNIPSEKAVPGPDGAAPFMAFIGGSIHLDVTMGTVSFGTDAGGRPVIREFKVTGKC